MKQREKDLLLIWALWAMSRPTHLLLIAFVYLFGSIIALANGVSLRPVPNWAGLLALLPLSASVHYANEYADFETDARTIRTPFSGGSGAFQRTGLPREIALRAAWSAAMVGSVTALVLYHRGFLSFPALAILAMGTSFGWMYSLKPLALGWKGLGELDNALLGGVLLPLYGYVAQGGDVELWIIVSLLPFGASVFVNLLATTWPDRVADRSVGKRTLATRLPAKSLRIIYWSVTFGIFISLPFLHDRVLPLEVVRSSLLIAPVMLWGGMRYTQQHSPLPTVIGMVLLLFAQFTAWWSTVNFCCLIGPV